MSLRYILGPSGSGKSEHCLQEITKENESDDTNALILIVPEQFSLESEKRLVALAHNHSIIRVQVLSFQRLAFHLFSEMGSTKMALLDESGKNMLLRKIVTQLANQLTYYKKSLQKQGFIEGLGKTITEFYRYNVSVDTLKVYLAKIEDKESLAMKLTDLSLIYEHYVQFIQKDYISTDETLDLLAEKIMEAPYLQDAVLWIDGFHGFTPQEYKVIGKLLHKVKQINMTFTVCEKATRFQNLKPHDGFYEIKKAINQLTAMATENNVRLETPLFLKETVRFGDNQPLKYLEKNFLNYRANAYEAPIQNIQLGMAANIYGEVAETAKAIYRLVQEEGYQYKEIGVVTAAFESYQKCMKGIFDTYEIPCFFDVKTDILSHPLTELVRSLIDIVVHNYSYESVFRFLKTNMVPIPREEMDLLENYVLAYGIKSYKWKMPQWQYGFQNTSQNYDSEAIHRAKELFLQYIQPFTEKIHAQSKASIRSFCGRIFETLIQLDVPRTLEEWMTQTKENAPLIYRQHRQIWGKITTVFDKMVEILGDEVVTVTEFGKILDAGLADVDMGLIPPTQDCVIVGDFQRTRLPKIKALFVLGVNEGVLPTPMGELGLFSDEERIYLSGMGMELGPDSNKKTYEEQFLIYSMMTQPTSYLQLSYALGTLEGKTLQPSSIIAKMKKLFPQIPIRIEKDTIDKVQEILGVEATFQHMGVVLKKYALNEPMTPIAYDLYNYFRTHASFAPKIQKMESLLFEKNAVRPLGKEVTRKLYGKELFSSVSRLERYVTCPYAHFLQYNMNAKERKIYEVETVDLGNLFHQVIEGFSHALAENNTTYRQVERTEMNRMIDQCVDQLVPQIGGEVLLSSERLKYIVTRVKRISKRSIWALCEHIKAGTFEPIGNEIEFSSDSPLNSIVIQINDEQKMILVGRIDRIDLFDSQQNHYIKVIDYKSGSKKFSLSDIYYGMQMQLLLYLDAFIKNGTQYFGKDNIHGKLMPGGVFYFNIDDPMLDITGKMTPEELEERILKEFKMSGLVLAKEEVIHAMDNQFSSDSAIIPVNIRKKDGAYGARSSVATAEEFESVQNYVLEKIKGIGQEILDGNIQVKPFKKGNQTGCDYCTFASICQFELVERQDRYQTMKKFDNDRMILEEMKKEQQKLDEDRM